MNTEMIKNLIQKAELDSKEIRAEIEDTINDCTKLLFKQFKQNNELYRARKIINN